MPIYPYSFTMPPVNKQDIPSDGVVGEFLGISAGGVLDWLPVAGGGGGGDMLKADNLSGLADYAIARTNIGLGLTSSPEFANLTLTSPSLSSSAPVTISQTWNAGTNVMTALRLNVTDTASGSTSKLLDLYAGVTPVSVFEVDKIGRLRIGSTASNAHGTRANPAFKIANNNSGFYTNVANGYINFAGSGTSPLCFAPAGIMLAASAYFQWTSGVNDPLDSSTVELALLRDATNTLALRNGALAQTFNVYGTYSTSPSLAYSRLAISCDTSGNATLTTQSTGVAGTVSINGVPVGLGKGGVVNNVAIGSSALSSLVGSSFNTAVGFSALANVTTGEGNTALGYQAFLNGNGGNNVVIGRAAANTLAAATNSVFIGTSCTGASGVQNQIVIGASAGGLGQDSVVLGNDSITKTALKGNVGIGTTAPGAPLHVQGTAIAGRESLMKASVSDAGNDAFHIYNATSANGIFVPGFSGSVFSTNSPAALVAFVGQTTQVNDIGGNAMLFQVRRTDNVTDPNNGVFSELVSKTLFAWQNHVTTHMAMLANGNLGIGTTSPTSKLHVVGDGLITGTLGIGDTGTSLKQFVIAGQAISNSLYISAPQYIGLNAPIVALMNGGVRSAMWDRLTGITLTASSYYGFGSHETDAGFAADTILRRDGEPYHLATRNGTNGQKFSVYGTYPGAAWERFTITAPTSGNVLLGTYKGTGGIARGLEFQTDGVTRMTLNAAGTAVIFPSGIALQRTDGGGVIFDFTYNGVQFANTDGLGVSWSTITGPASLKHVGVYGYASEPGVVQVNSSVKGTLRDLRCRSVIEQPPASITPTLNGDLVVEATSNTTLTFKLKGTDGTVRTGTITLA